jgi:hypothetical protein
MNGQVSSAEVKTGFYRKRSMETGSSETLIGENLEKPLLSLYGSEWRERGYGLSGMWKLGLRPHNSQKREQYSNAIFVAMCSSNSK